MSDKAMGVVPPDPNGIAVAMRLGAEDGGRFLVGQLHNWRSNPVREYIISSVAKLMTQGTNDQRNVNFDLATTALVESIQNLIHYDPGNDVDPGAGSFVFVNWGGSKWSGWSPPSTIDILAYLTPMMTEALGRAAAANQKKVTPVPNRMKIDFSGAIALKKQNDALAAQAQADQLSTQRLSLIRAAPSPAPAPAALAPQASGLTVGAYVSNHPIAVAAAALATAVGIYYATR